MGGRGSAGGSSRNTKIAGATVKFEGGYKIEYESVRQNGKLFTSSEIDGRINFW